MNSDFSSMRIHFDNVDFSSSSGPNSFGLKLAKSISNLGHVVVNSDENPDVQLSFIQSLQMSKVPLVQRLDGVWFNSKQQWKAQNEPIKSTYDRSKAVIVQSDFDAKLVSKFFGSHQKMVTIRNGTDIELVQSIDPLSVPSLRDVEKVWTCAASWRPHKRLAENIRYFLEYAGQKDVLVIAGENVDVAVADSRIFWTGKLDYFTLVSLFRASDYFLHLAWLDHCPNVVVDARAAGSHVICSSSGGTREVAGPDATVILEDEWDFEPCELYNPPALDFSRVAKNDVDADIDISNVAKQYANVLGSVFKGEL